MPSGSAPNIPNDVWLSVAEFATKEVLYNLCLVSKNLYLLLQTYLFRDHFQSHIESAESALRVCLARPDLAAVVRRLKVWDNDGSLPTDGSDWHREYDAQIQRLQEERWPSGSEYSKTSKDAVLLWSMVPNVQHLVLEISPTDSTLGDAFAYAKEHWTLTDPLLSKVTHLQLDWPFDEDGIDLQSLPHLLCLPSLKVWKGHACNFEDHETAVLANKRGQLNIEHVDLRCSVATSRRIKELLQACRSVKTFRITYGEITTGGVAEYDFNELREAFEVHKSTLESVVIDFEGDTATEILEDDAVWGILDVSKMECLRHIDMPWWSLFRNGVNEEGPQTIKGWEMFPRSLESLVLRGCDDSVWPSMNNILSSLDEFSSLKHIVIQGPVEFEDDESMAGCAEECLDKGIGFNEEKFLKRQDHSDLFLRYINQCVESEYEAETTDEFQ